MPWLLLVALVGGGAAVSAQPSETEQRALAMRVQDRYDVVPLSDGIALRPKTRTRDVRLIEIADGTVSINGDVVSGRELKERLGADAEAILRLSFMPARELQDLFRLHGAVQPPPSQPPLEPVGPAPPPMPGPPPDMTRRRDQRSHGDRVRIFGDVHVREDEEVTGQVVAVIGSVRIDGEVGNQVVAVLGSVELGPKAIVRGDIVSVGGRVRRTPGAQTGGGVTEVSLADSDFGIHIGPWMGDWGPFPWTMGFGAFPRLIGSGFRLLLLLIVTATVFLVARRSVDASAQRVTDNPVKVTVVGLLAELLAFPVLLLTAILLAVSIIGIPLLLLLPFVVLLLIVMALVGFTGTAAALGHWLHRRFGIGGGTAYAAVLFGVLLILSPVLIGRLLGLLGWPLTPFAMLFVGFGFAVELLAWASGFGAMITNAFTRWQAQRAARA